MRVSAVGERCHLHKSSSNAPKASSKSSSDKKKLQTALAKANGANADLVELVETKRCLEHLSKKPGQSSTQSTYKRKCEAHLENMCQQTRNQILSGTSTCTVFDVYNGKGCCYGVKEVKDETPAEAAQRMTRVFLKLAEDSTTVAERKNILTMLRAFADARKEKKKWRELIRKMFQYVKKSVLEFDIRQPILLMIMVTAIILVVLGMTSRIVSKLTNRVGTWTIGQTMTGLGGDAAEFATRTELTRASMQDKTRLWNMGVIFMRTALTFKFVRPLTGSWGAAAAVLAVLREMPDVDLPAGAANTGVMTGVTAVTQAFVQFLWQSSDVIEKMFGEPEFDEL